MSVMRYCLKFQSFTDSTRHLIPAPGCFLDRCIYHCRPTVSDIQFSPLTPNNHCSGRTAPLTSKRCILYIYSTNTGTQYFKHGIYAPFFSLQNAVCFVILTYLAPVLFTFYIQCVLKLKKKNSGAKRLRNLRRGL